MPGIGLGENLQVSGSLGQKMREMKNCSLQSLAVGLQGREDRVKREGDAMLLMQNLFLMVKE